LSNFRTTYITDAEGKVIAIIILDEDGNYIGTVDYEVPKSPPLDVQDIQIGIKKTIGDVKSEWEVILVKEKLIGIFNKETKSFIPIKDYVSPDSKVSVQKSNGSLSILVDNKVILTVKDNGSEDYDTRVSPGQPGSKGPQGLPVSPGSPIQSRPQQGQLRSPTQSGPQQQQPISQGPMSRGTYTSQNVRTGYPSEVRRISYSYLVDRLHRLKEKGCGTLFQDCNNSVANKELVVTDLDHGIKRVEFRGGTLQNRLSQLREKLLK
jgi:hypothetical protein